MDEQEEVFQEEIETISVPAELKKEEAPLGILDLVNIQEMDMLEFDRVAKDLIEKVKKFTKYALRITNERDWTDHGGEPYLAASGAEKIRKLFGINIKIDPNRVYKEMREDSKGKFYIYTVHGFAWKGAVGMSAVGTCSSRDKFFAYANRKLKPIEDISETNIMKKAISNFEGNAIKRYLGLRNLSWKELEDAGLVRSKIKVVTFKGQKTKDEDGGKKDLTPEKRATITTIEDLLDKIEIPKKAKDGMRRLIPSMDEKGLGFMIKKLNKFNRLDKTVIDKLYELPKQFRDNLLKDDEFMAEDKDTQINDISTLKNSLPKSAWDK